MSKIQLTAGAVLGPAPKPPRRHRGRLSKNARKAFRQRCGRYHEVWATVRKTGTFKSLQESHLEQVATMEKGVGAVPKSTDLPPLGMIISWRRKVGNWHPRRRRQLPAGSALRRAAGG